ncbi:MAG: hypothetical protein KDA88_15015 [Planctomycetaceae bacterium]|nr:hypothetical protein [Planctomycetaceae bacterium]MCA9029314.1 hypothetical protein [Planctomycetaceae bacterium]
MGLAPAAMFNPRQFITVAGHVETSVMVGCVRKMDASEIFLAFTREDLIYTPQVPGGLHPPYEYSCVPTARIPEA